MSGSQNNPYSETKALWHLDRIAALREGRQIVPTHVQIILSDLCSHDCSFCSYRWDGNISNQQFAIIDPATGQKNHNPNRMLPFDKVIEVLDDCKEMGVKAVQFSVWANERIPVKPPEQPTQTVAIGEFVDSLFGGPSKDGRHECLNTTGKGIMAYAINNDGEVVLDEIEAVYRHKAPEPLAEVTLAGGRKIVVTVSHSLNVVRGGRIVKVPVSQLSAGDEVACANWLPQGPMPKFLPVPAAQGNEWAAKDVGERAELTADLFRLLGYYTAEGSSNSRSLCWIFGNGPREEEYRADCLRCIRSVFGVDGRADEKGRRVYLDSVRAQSFFIEICKAGGTQADRAIPWFIWSAPDDLKWEYLRGLFSGDGNFRSGLHANGHARNSLHLKTCNRNLAQECASLFRQLGVVATVSQGVNPRRKIEGRVLDESVYYSVNVHDRISLEKCEPILLALRATLRFADSIYSAYGSRVARIRFGNEAERIPIKSIRIAHELGRPMVYDVTVKGTHRFLSSSGIGCANTGGGEPTVYPQHHEVFCHALNLGLEVSLVTHGVLLKPKVIETLARGAAWVRVSIDAGNPKTYSAVRRVGESQYWRALDNVRLLCEARDRLAGKLVVGVGFVVTKDNWREVIDAANTARELGVNSFRISAVFQPNGEEYFKDFYDDAAELCNDAASLSSERFRVTNSFGNRVADLHQGPPDYQQCGYMEFTTYLAGNGNAYRCCNTSYNEHGLIGSFLDKRFKDLWFSQEKEENFRRFDARSCERCQFNGANRAINAALHEPMHASFV